MNSEPISHSYCVFIVDFEQVNVYWRSSFLLKFIFINVKTKHNTNTLENIRKPSRDSWHPLSKIKLILKYSSTKNLRLLLLFWKASVTSIEKHLRNFMYLMNWKPALKSFHQFYSSFSQEKVF